MTVQMFQPGQQTLTLTDAALEQARREIARSGAQGLRLAVKPSGCSGYKYVLDYVQAPEADDIRFEQAEGVVLFVDARSLPLVSGTVIDYVHEGLNRLFRFSNPNAQGECGCGESFSVEVG